MVLSILLLPWKPSTLNCYMSSKQANWYHSRSSPLGNLLQEMHHVHDYVQQTRPEWGVVHTELCSEVVGCQSCHCQSLGQPSRRPLVGIYWKWWRPRDRYVRMGTDWRLLSGDRIGYGRVFLYCILSFHSLWYYNYQNRAQFYNVCNVYDSSHRKTKTIF